MRRLGKRIWVRVAIYVPLIVGLLVYRAYVAQRTPSPPLDRSPSAETSTVTLPDGTVREVRWIRADELDKLRPQDLQPSS